MNDFAIKSQIICAAAYVRMSSDQQQYSTLNQLDVIRQYALNKGWKIVNVYSDDGKSGLNIEGREVLTEMIRVIQSGEADYSVVLVYDVSRWGRFEDADESAHYEYICRKSGVQVHYCAELFENDGRSISTLLKNIKRAMASEYSRELSDKVFYGQSRLASMGYKAGGIAGFGLRRMLVDESGVAKTVLQAGEQKSVQRDRVVIVPGPETETDVVRSIYSMFIDERMNEKEIAKVLGAQGIPTGHKRPWNPRKVRRILTNEAYIGNMIYFRRSTRMKGRLVNNPPEKWIRKDGAFQHIVEPRRFNEAQEIFRARRIPPNDEEILSKLRALLFYHGRLSTAIIQKASDMPSVNFISRRFGGLLSVYRLVGYKTSRT